MNTHIGSYPAIHPSIHLLIHTQSRFRSRCMPERSQNVTDSSPCQCQSSRRVSWKSAGDCMRNANKSPTISYSAMPREVEKYTRSPYMGLDHQQKLTGSSGWYPVGPIIAQSFNKNQLITFAEILLRDRQTDRQTDKQTDRQTKWMSDNKPTWLHNLRLGKGKNYCIWIKTVPKI